MHLLKTRVNGVCYPIYQYLVLILKKKEKKKKTGLPKTAGGYDLIFQNTDMRNRTRLSFFVVVFETVVLFLLFQLLCPLFIIAFGLGGRSLSTDQDAFFFFFFNYLKKRKGKKNRKRSTSR